MIELAKSLKAQPPSLKLFELVDALNAIDAQLEESDGLLTPEIEAALDGLQGSLTEKVESICRLRQNRLLSAETCEQEAERLKKRAGTFKKSADSLKTFLHAALDRLGIDKLRTPAFTVYTQANPPSVRWTKNVWELPSDFRRVTVEPDLERAQQALKSGEPLPEGFEVIRNNHLRIR